MTSKEKEIHQTPTENSQQIFLQLSKNRINDLKQRIKESEYKNDFSSYILKKSLKIEKDVLKVIENDIPLEEFFGVYMIGFYKKHVFCVNLLSQDGETKFQGISDVNGRERFTGTSAEDILRFHLVPNNRHTTW